MLEGPSMTLQYDPAAKPVANVALHALSWLLMATKPEEPVRYAVSCSAAKNEGVGTYRGQRQSAETMARPRR